MGIFSTSKKNKASASTSSTNAGRLQRRDALCEGQCPPPARGPPSPPATRPRAGSTRPRAGSIAPTMTVTASTTKDTVGIAVGIAPRKANAYLSALAPQLPDGSTMKDHVCVRATTLKEGPGRIKIEATDDAGRCFMRAAAEIEEGMRRLGVDVSDRCTAVKAVKFSN